ncbi:papilin-like isoform X4 [Leptidea sinapis]|uniref:papilin-like isoform X4 n=1 Tax=Leptidea sinapis TaxID=189913 RepID=UPI0021C44774|nr:papilin-like isoform X4 [Leptidea sinapis]
MTSFILLHKNCINISCIACSSIYINELCCLFNRVCCRVESISQYFNVFVFVSYYNNCDINETINSRSRYLVESIGLGSIVHYFSPHARTVMIFTVILVVTFLLTCAGVSQDPVEGPAGVANIPNEEIFGDLGQPLRIRCLVYGYPTPTIYWYRGLNGPMVPYSSSLYEARDNVLLIRKLNEETIGEYACHAYNGIGSSAIWPFVVQASRPDGSVEIPKHVTQLEVPVTTPQIQTQASTTPAPENQVPLYAVPVTTRINAERTQVVAGSEIRLACDVDGYPEPRVQWTKDRMQLTATDRIQITETRLTIFRAQSNDSGEYSCEAANEYTSHSSVINVTVKGIYIPPTCVDSPYFADCHLIIRSNYCRHKYYSKFCCKSCVEAGQLEAEEAELMQADMSFRRKK